VPPFLYRLSRYVRVQLVSWRLPLVIIVVVFLTSWAAMALVEPAGSGIARPANYWWYFLITAATVGYGDLTPSSTAGRVVGAYVVVGGIVTLTLLFTRIADSIQYHRGRRMKGAVDLDLEGHVVLLGYTRGRTERILAELTAEGGLDVALCAWEDVEGNPVPERPAVHFVRGDLTDADVMRRACVHRARTVVIDARDDNEALALAVTVDHANPGVHVVAALRDLSRREHLRYVSSRIQCVQWHTPFLLTEEALDPGITQVYNDLMRTGGHGNTYSARVPARFPHRSAGDCQTWLGRTFGATLLAVRHGEELVVSPAWDRPLEAGTVLYYVARERIGAERLSSGR
jgi:voltage-gated potassium channel